MRPSWDAYFMEMAAVVGRRSPCLRRQIGSLVVKEKRILSTGYNGAPTGLAHCAETGCLRQEQNIPSGERHELCRGLHAEQNAIIQAALYGISLRGSTIYSSVQPCLICSKMIINAGIERVVYREAYPHDLAAKLLSEAGVALVAFGE
ncbi:MAG: cytidine/deoxycytidylate deaminase family protein [Bacillota bacterium]